MNVQGTGNAAAAAQAQAMAEIQRMNDVVETATLKQADFATKLTKLAVGQGIDDQQQATAMAALDRVV